MLQSIQDGQRNCSESLKGWKKATRKDNTETGEAKSERGSSQPQNTVELCVDFAHNFLVHLSPSKRQRQLLMTKFKQVYSI